MLFSRFVFRADDVAIDESFEETSGYWRIGTGDWVPIDPGY